LLQKNGTCQSLVSNFGDEFINRIGFSYQYPDNGKTPILRGTSACSEKRLNLLTQFSQSNPLCITSNPHSDKAAPFVITYGKTFLRGTPRYIRSINALTGSGVFLGAHFCAASVHCKKITRKAGTKKPGPGKAETWHLPADIYSLPCPLPPDRARKARAIPHALPDMMCLLSSPTNNNS
jgi:hypothetical protein